MTTTLTTSDNHPPLNNVGQGWEVPFICTPETVHQFPETRVQRAGTEDNRSHEMGWWGLLWMSWQLVLSRCER